MDCWEILLKDTIRHLWRGEGKWKKECFLPYQWTSMPQSSAIPTLQGAQEDYLQDLAASGPQPLPTVAQDVKLRNWGCENTGYWPQIVEMYRKGMISVSSDSHIVPYIEKCLLFCCLGPKWCLTLCDPMNCSPAGFSVHGTVQAITLEQFAVSFSRGSSRPQDRAPFSCAACIGRKILYRWATRKEIP